MPQCVDQNGAVTAFDCLVAPCECPAGTTEIGGIKTGSPSPYPTTAYQGLPVININIPANPPVIGQNGSPTIFGFSPLLVIGVGVAALFFFGGSESKSK